jgi:phosphatidylserine/phosphatidylglycerophosphate/cardiolipin synthase-like enzyme
MIDSARNIAHNKVMIVDGQTVITGSFNFTTSAEDRNAKKWWASGTRASRLSRPADRGSGVRAMRSMRG